MSDYMFMLDSHLDALQNRAVAEMQRMATEAGMNVWLAGGAMRDMLRGSRIRDLDFTVERDALKFGKLAVQTLGAEILEEDTLKRWVELMLPGGTRASVSNARTEKYSKPGGKPQIAPATIHDDLLRRDFTINAIALSLNRGSRGLLIDPSNGQADLANRELRATNPYIFFDDPSRIFRLVRFEHMLGLQVSARVQSQLENALLEEYQKTAPPTALAAEIRALSTSENVVPALEAYERLGLLTLLLPGLTGAKLNTAGLARYEKLLHGVLPPETLGGFVAFLAVLTEKLNPRERTELLRVFNLSKAEADGLKKLDADAKKLEAALKGPKLTRPSHVYELLAEATSGQILMVLYRSLQRVVQDRIRAFYEKYLPMAQEVTEEQVAATGVKAGTPKFEKAWKTMIATHLNARPRKITPEEEAAAAAPPPPPAPTSAFARGIRR
jgi:tRNA nucleotidyltransferase/poly(A) polymerase